MSDNIEWFRAAMEHVGLHPIIIDEDTVMPNDNGDEPKVTILDKATVTASQDYTCINCSRLIKKDLHYVHVRIRVGGKEIQKQHWCLPCWLGE